MHIALKIAVVSLGAAALACGADLTEEFHSEHALRSGGTLRVRNVNGSVEITSWDRESIAVDAVKHASSPELLNATRVEVRSDGDGVLVQTIVPEHRHGSAGAQLVLRVPRRINLEEVSSSNGRIRVSGVTGSAALSTSNGSIQAEITGGRFRADTSNGAIEASLRGAEVREPIILDTSNGRISLTLDTPSVPEIRADTSNSSIELHLPAATNARLEASTSNSEISSDFEVTTRSLSKDSLHGRIGEGGPLLKLDTSNGPIRVLRN